MSAAKSDWVNQSCIGGAPEARSKARDGRNGAEKDRRVVEVSGTRLEAAEEVVVAEEASGSEPGAGGSEPELQAEMLRFQGNWGKGDKDTWCSYK